MRSSPISRLSSLKRCFDSLKESYGSLESKRLLEASHNILKTVEDEGLGATFSTGFKGFGGFGVSPVFGFGDSSKLFGYKHVGRREGNLHLYVV